MRMLILTLALLIGGLIGGLAAAQPDPVAADYVIWRKTDGTPTNGPVVTPTPVMIATGNTP